MIQALAPILASVGRAAAAGATRAAGSGRLASFTMGRMSASGNSQESTQPSNPTVSDVTSDIR